MAALTFLVPRDVPRDRLLVYRAFPLASVIVTSIPVVLACAWSWWAHPDPPIAGVQMTVRSVVGLDRYLLGVCTLFWAVAANDVRKALTATGWLAASGPEGLFVKWRSYQNSHWGTDDVQVVRIPFDAIASARVLDRWWVTPDGRYGGGRSEPARYVELTLAPHVSMAELATRLADERAGRPNGRSIGWKGLWGDVPVSVEDGHILRIRWRAWPRAHAFVERLREHGVPTSTPGHDEIDLHSGVTDASLRQLARTGDVFGLVRTLRAHDRALSLADARAQATALITAARTDH